MKIFIRNNLSLKVITKRISNLIEINFFKKCFLDKIYVNWNCTNKENSYENRF